MTKFFISYYKVNVFAIYYRNTKTMYYNIKFKGEEQLIHIV